MFTTQYFVGIWELWSSIALLSKFCDIQINLFGYGTQNKIGYCDLKNRSTSCLMIVLIKEKLKPLALTYFKPCIIFVTQHLFPCGLSQMAQRKVWLKFANIQFKQTNFPNEMTN